MGQNVCMFTTKMHAHFILKSSIVIFDRIIRVFIFNIYLLDSLNNHHFHSLSIWKDL